MKKTFKEWISLAARSCLFLLLTPAAQRGMGQSAGPGEKLVFVQEGSVPIILSAPHGGRLPIPGTSARTGKDKDGQAVKQFATVLDGGTEELTRTLGREIEFRLREKPHLVTARFTRSHADVNRPAGDAFEAETAKPVYEAYHAALQRARDRVEKDFKRGILLDIHGQAHQADTIYRGTSKLSTVSHLVNRFGRGALTGPKSVLGAMQAAGYRVFPAGDSTEPEQKGYTGGFIVRTYGSGSGGTVDAIQLELGANLRKAGQRDQVAADLADAICRFAVEYLEWPGRERAAERMKSFQPAAKPAKAGS